MKYDVARNKYVTENRNSTANRNITTPRSLIRKKKDVNWSEVLKEIGSRQNVIGEASDTDVSLQSKTARNASEFALIMLESERYGKNSVKKEAIRSEDWKEETSMDQMRNLRTSNNPEAELLSPSVINSINENQKGRLHAMPSKESRRPEQDATYKMTIKNTNTGKSKTRLNQEGEFHATILKSQHRAHLSGALLRGMPRSAKLVNQTLGGGELNTTRGKAVNETRLR